MKKIILIDGNNLMFRSYFATIYSGTMMKNSNGFPTNALYGFNNMINKIIEEEKPNYMVVAFDIGKNFRHDEYQEYKAGRAEMPPELKLQMVKARDLLNALGVKYLEKEMYEADDIIGTIVKMCANDEEFSATIVSSDRDLLQLINYETEVKLLKQKDYVRYNEETFIKDYGIPPIKIIDMKALAGDSSDNIPGVKGIGDKTALSLLQKYGSLEGIYSNVDTIKGATKEKLIKDKDMAFFSKMLATIYCDVPLDISLEELKYEGKDFSKLRGIYEELEFYSFLKNLDNPQKEEKLEYKVINDLDKLDIVNEYAFYLECDKVNYHEGTVLGMGVFTDKSYYIPAHLIKDFFNKYQKLNSYTFDLKKSLSLLEKLNVSIKCQYDLMIAYYLLNINIKDDDLAYGMQKEAISVPFYATLLKNKFEDLETEVVLKAKYIMESKAKYLDLLEKEDALSLFKDMEIPLCYVLFDMEKEGIIVNKDILIKMQSELQIKIERVSKEIYNLAGEEFNISSPKQLGDILFIKMGLPSPKKNNRGFKTDVTVLHKLKDRHSIISKILEYRNLVKINSTYIEGLYKYITVDNKIHTIYKQTLTRTGRLSSVEPNLQNIPVKEEEGRKIRKAFLASPNSVLLSADYSQIELRILAHISQDETLINSFRNGEDIHTKVASDIYGVPIEAVTKEMRKNAKAVIFGIVYGISGFGLGENLSITLKEAKNFINKYYEFYPKVKKYMEDIVIDAKEKGYVHTLYNRKRIIDELNNSNFMIRQAGERIALNTPIQGTSADIIKMAMINIKEKFRENSLKSKMILQVHDELIFDTLNSELEVVIKIVREEMENVVKLSVPLKVEIDSGETWYEAK